MACKVLTDLSIFKRLMIFFKSYYVQQQYLFLYYYQRNHLIMKFNSPFKERSKQSEISVSIKLPLKFNQTNIHLCFKRQDHRTINNPLKQLYSQRTRGRDSTNNRRVVIQSANVSQQKEIQQRDVNKNIQFNKVLKDKLKSLHKRTKSNHIELAVLKEDQLSNFSNSIQNISQEIIQIPFAKKKIITGSNRVQNGQLKLNNFVNSCKNSIEKRKSPIVKIPIQASSKEKIINKQNRDKIKFKLQKPLVISRWQESVKLQNLLNLSDFNLKAIKITEGGSIVYLAMHKKTSSIYAVKSIKKKIISSNFQSFILQLKLSILINNPNIAKIYGFFTDADNFYVIKEYLQEGCINNIKKRVNQMDIGCQFNNILNGVMSISSLIDCRFWWIDLRNVAQTHGICKITSIKVNQKGSYEVFSEKLKHSLLILLQSERKSELVKDFFQTNESINLNMLRNGSFFISALRQIIESIVILSQNQILMLWNTQFLKQYRYKALMQQ